MKTATAAISSPDPATETVDLRAEAVPIATLVHGDEHAQVQRGYVYRCSAESADASEGVGYFGDDSPPCAAEYLCCADASEGTYLVISTEASADDIHVVDGWNLEPAEDLEVGEVFDDGVWVVVVVKARGHLCTVAGSL